MVPLPSLLKHAENLDSLNATSFSFKDLAIAAKLFQTGLKLRARFFFLERVLSCWSTMQTGTAAILPFEFAALDCIVCNSAQSQTTPLTFNY